MKVLFLALTILFIAACDNKTTSPQQGRVNEDEIYSGGVPRDGIPALINPEFIAAADASYLGISDLVLGLVINGEARAYPVKIMNYHEIANDLFLNHSICITYCPLTGSGLAHSRVIGGQESEFGVSGLLFRNNLIPYDRVSGSLYSQMYGKGIRGDHRDIDWLLYPIVECTWEYWRSQYPDTKVLSLETGYDRPYSENPYGSYPVSYSTLFPIAFPDNRYHPKTKTLGVVFGGQSMAFPRDELFQERVFNLSVADVPLVVFYEPTAKLIAAYSRVVNGDTLDFSLVNSGNRYMTMSDDQTGTIWTAMGIAVDGELTGTSLERFPFYTAYWFAWHDFYPETTVYTD